MGHMLTRIMIFYGLEIQHPYQKCCFLTYGLDVDIADQIPEYDSTTLHTSKNIPKTILPHFNMSVLPILFQTLLYKPIKFFSANHSNINNPHNLVRTQRNTPSLLNYA